MLRKEGKEERGEENEERREWMLMGGKRRKRGWMRGKREESRNVAKREGKRSEGKWKGVKRFY